VVYYSELFFEISASPLTATARVLAVFPSSDASLAYLNVKHHLRPRVYSIAPATSEDILRVLVENGKEIGGNGVYAMVTERHYCFMVVLGARDVHEIRKSLEASGYLEVCLFQSIFNQST
jgi:hypothetical protein